MSTYEILVGDVFEQLRTLPDESVDIVVTSPPYWGLRKYADPGTPEEKYEIGLEPTLAEHLQVMVNLFNEIRRVLKPKGCVWLNYGDTYATKPNGRSAAAVKAAGNDDRTFRDKPFSTIGPIYVPIGEKRRNSRGPKNRRLHDGRVKGGISQPGQIHASGYLKPKDLCMIPNRLAIALQDAGWWVRSEIVWAKPNPMPDSSGKYRPSTSHEKIFLLTKSEHSYYDHMAVKMPVSGGANARVSKAIMGHATQMNALFAEDEMASMKPRARPPGVGPKAAATPMGEGIRSNADSQAKMSRQIYEDRFLRNWESDLSPIVPPQVWEIPTASFSEAHFATFPPALVVPCILSSCPAGGTVLDPFGGAGTVALVAQRLGRNSILIELLPKYAKMAHRRIKNGLIGFAEMAS